ncbi:MAG: hypothetical protein IJ189_13455 [Clostridia bacterium]|nr:hypothetical protein [Clostridia bacterium]
MLRERKSAQKRPSTVGADSIRPLVGRGERWKIYVHQHVSDERMLSSYILVEALGTLLFCTSRKMSKRATPLLLF